MIRSILDPAPRWPRLEPPERLRLSARPRLPLDGYARRAADPTTLAPVNRSQNRAIHRPPVHRRPAAAFRFAGRSADASDCADRPVTPEVLCLLWSKSDTRWNFR